MGCALLIAMHYGTALDILHYDLGNDCKMADNGKRALYKGLSCFLRQIIDI